MKEVFGRVFIGSSDDASDVLRAATLAQGPPSFPTHVLSIVSPMEPPPPDFAALNKRMPPPEYRMVHTIVYLNDTPTANLIRVVGQCCDAITEGRLARRGSGVLVHCGAGGSRSAAVVTAFLMTQHNGRLDPARDALRAAYPHAHPNHGFVMQLQLWELMRCAVDGWSPAHEAYRYLNRVGLGGDTEKFDAGVQAADDSMDIVVTSQLLRELGEGRWREPAAAGVIDDRYREHLERSGFTHGLRRMLSNMAGFLGVTNYSTEEPATQITRTAEIPSATYEGSLMSRRQRKF
jgi:hypothetical protein